MMKNTNTNSILQAQVRSALRQLRELEELGEDLTVQGECRSRLEKVRAAYRQVLWACFDGIDWEDPG